jgi:hypothetical protein
MTRRNLIVDGMLSGTGIRDAYSGGYVDSREVGLSVNLIERIAKWLLDYENAHYQQFTDRSENERLDKEGVAITRLIREELPGALVHYFSNAEMRKIDVI